MQHKRMFVRTVPQIYLYAAGLLLFFAVTTFIIAFFTGPPHRYQEVSYISSFKASVPKNVSELKKSRRSNRLTSSKGISPPSPLIAPIVEALVKKELERLDVKFPNRTAVANQIQILVKELQSEINDIKILERSLNLAQRFVTPVQVTPLEAPFLGDVVKALEKLPIMAVDVGKKGTQLKLHLRFEGGQEAVLKPMFYKRDEVIRGEPFAGADRHNGEIVAFYLSRILNFRLTPIAVGRVFNVENDILAFATDNLRKTFFNKGRQKCFYGKCYFCSMKNAVCGDMTGKLEAAIILWLPMDFPLAVHRHPWQRTYRNGTYARWERDPKYCVRLRSNSKTFASGRRLADLIDASVFDYLIGNADRHHYETFADYPSSGAVIMLDNGKSFGDADKDEFSILAPLYQCCKIRRSTYEQLQRWRGFLGEAVGNVTRVDVLYPLLTEPHLKSLDRRLETILATVHWCARGGVLSSLNPKTLTEKSPSSIDMNYFNLNAVLVE